MRFSYLVVRAWPLRTKVTLISLHFGRYIAPRAPRTSKYMTDFHLLWVYQSGSLDTREADPLFDEHQFDAECRPGAPLTPEAMADRDALRFAGTDVPHRFADAAT
jgi:hypothetical protein